MKLGKNNLIEKIINFLLNVLIFIFGIILLISIYTGVQTKILGNKYTNFFGYSMFEVQTGSMADAINPGDWIIVKLTQKVKLDDIVTYESKGEYITHRVIEVYSGTYVTKGDANSAKDDPIDQKQVIGKVVNILGNIGILRRTLFNPSVLIALIITLFLANIAFRKNKKETSKDDNNLFSDVIVRKVNVWLQKIMKPKNNKQEEMIDVLKIDNKNLKKFESSSNNITKEEDLEKTALFRVVSVDADEVDSKFKNKISKTEDIKPTEEDLEKTALYRVISVDLDDEKKDSEPTKDEPISKPETDETSEDDLDKTMIFRVIPVDLSDKDSTLLEIAENEMKNAKQEEKIEQERQKKKELQQEDEEEEPEDDGLTKINLDLLKNSRKGKNIIDTAMIIKEEELNEIIDVLLDSKTRPNEATIKESFINTYIDAKYYSNDGENRNSISKIEKIMKEMANKLVSDYKGSNTKFDDITDTYTKIFILITNLEQARDSITDFRVKNEFYKKEVMKYAKDWNIDKIEDTIDEIIAIQKKYIDILEFSLQKLQTNMFNLNFNKISNVKDMYGLELEHNIAFSKVYSDYIIDKTYTEGIIAEDKITVLLTLLSVQLIKDMTSPNYNKKYVFYIPQSLYTKEKKLEKLLRMIDDKYAMNNVIILISYDDLLNNKQILKRVRKMGYKFALMFDKEVKIGEKEKGNIYIADYIFINKKTVRTTSIIPFIPDDLLDKIIYEDITDKVGDFGGE